MRVQPKAAPLVLAILLGCGATRHPSGDDAAAPRPVSAARATEVIAAARCEHERRCDEPTTAQPYRSREACTADYRASAAADLASHPCAAGIDPARLRACTTMLERESCHPLTALPRMVTCSPAELCIQIAAVHMTEDEAYGP